MTSTMGNPTVLRISELERIRASVLPPVEDRRATERKSQLKAMSQERLKMWPNTLEATRKKKETFIKDREDAAESRRQEIDAEEAEFRRENRLATIRKANDLIYDQTDKMKMLRSQRQFAEVIHHRGFMIDTKEKELHKDIDREAAFHQDILRQVNAGNAEDERKAKVLSANIEAIKISRRAQLEDVRAVREADDKRDYEEGQRMKREANERVTEDIRVQEAKGKAQIERNYKAAEASKRDSVVKQEMKAGQEAEIASRDAEVWKIDDRKERIKQRKEEMHDEAQAVRMAMIERAVEQLKLQTNSHQVLLNKQIADQRAKADKATFDKEEKIRLEWEATVNSRSAQVAKKAKEKADEKAIDDHLAAKWKKQNEDGIQEAKEKVQRARDAQTAVKHEQKEEGKRVNGLKRMEAEREVAASKFLLSLQGDDDAKFTNACKTEITKNVMDGKPIYPLLRALEFTQAPLLAAKTIKVIRQKRDA